MVDSDDDDDNDIEILNISKLCILAQFRLTSLLLINFVFYLLLHEQLYILFVEVVIVKLFKILNVSL